MTSWGDWDYGGGNGMRVGFDWDVSSVSNSSSSVKITIDIKTDNQYSYDDSQKLSYGGDLDSASDTSFTNNDGTSTQTRATKTLTHNYSSSSYGSSPGKWSWSAKISGAYNGVTPSHSTSVTIPARPYATPAAPTACVATRQTDTAALISWTNHASTGAPYDAMWVERYVHNYLAWQRVGTLSGSPTSWTDTGVIPNRRYAWRVQADNSVGTSGYAQSAVIYTTPAPPASPARVQSGVNQVLTWTLAMGYTEHLIEVWRAVNGTYALLTTVASGVTTYTDTTSSASTKVKYKFRTKTSEGPVLYSAYSAETTETIGVLTAPSAPTSLVPSSGIIDPSNPIQHTWRHNTTDTTSQTAYQVQYRYVGDTTWIQTGKITSTAASWTMPAGARANGRQVEWQVQTWGASPTASPFSASAIWTTAPVVALKYPLFLDVSSGRTEADSAVTVITEQVRRVGSASRTTSGSNSTTPYNILTFPLPAEMAVRGKKLRITALANIFPSLDGMFTELQVRIGIGATTAGTIILSAYTDHRVAGRQVAVNFSGEYTFDPVSAGAENVSTINIVLVGAPGSGGGSYSAQNTQRPAFLIVDEIISGSSTASGGGGGGTGTDNEVVISATQPTPANGQPELWLDLLSSGTVSLPTPAPGLPSSAPGTGSVPAMPNTLGLPALFDSAGMLRTLAPLLSADDGSFANATSPTQYPTGATIMTVGNAAAVAGGWPVGASGIVLTFKRFDQNPINGAVVQIWSTNTTTQANYQLLFRCSTGTAWGPWQVIGGAAAAALYYGYAQSTATVSLTTTAATDITGMTLTVPVASTASVYAVTCTFDVTQYLAGAANFLGSLSAGGTTFPNPQVIWNPQSTAVNQRIIISQQWRVTGLAAGNQIFKGIGSCATINMFRLNSTHCTIAVQQVA